MVQKIKDHIYISKNIRKCKGCKVLTIIKYLGNELCEDCDKKYKEIINKII